MNREKWDLGPSGLAVSRGGGGEGWLNILRQKPVNDSVQCTVLRDEEACRSNPVLVLQSCVFLGFTDFC